MAKPPHTRAALRALYPVCQVAELAAGYRDTTIEQHISALVRPFTHHEGHDEPPAWDKGHPHPRLPRGLLLGKRNKKVAVFMICSLLRGTMEGAMHDGL